MWGLCLFSSVGLNDRFYQTTDQINALFQNPDEQNEIREVEVTDPTHPLFGRCFPVKSISNPARGIGYVFVSYRKHMTLRIPYSATNLAELKVTQMQSKLSEQALIELLSIAKQCEVLCPTNQKKSGSASAHKQKRKSLKRSRRSSKE